MVCVEMHKEWQRQSITCQLVHSSVPARARTESEGKSLVLHLSLHMVGGDAGT